MEDSPTSLIFITLLATLIFRTTSPNFKQSCLVLINVFKYSLAVLTLLISFTIKGLVSFKRSLILTMTGLKT